MRNKLIALTLFALTLICFALSGCDWLDPFIHPENHGGSPFP